jgi:hypothetical protein
LSSPSTDTIIRHRKNVPNFYHVFPLEDRIWLKAQQREREAELHLFQVKSMIWNKTTRQNEKRGMYITVFDESKDVGMHDDGGECM